MSTKHTRYHRNMQARAAAIAIVASWATWLAACGPQRSAVPPSEATAETAGPGETATPTPAPTPQTSALGDLEKYDRELAAMDREFAAIPADIHDRDWVKKKLAHMNRLDQFWRTKWAPDAFADPARAALMDEYRVRLLAVDRRNVRDLKELLTAYTWFSPRVFGHETENDAWTIVQHADHDVAFQERVLADLESLVAAGDATKSNYAYLHDRVSHARNRPQRYGTQGDCEGHVWKPFALEDPDKLDEYRAAMGLGPMDAYQKSVSLAWLSEFGKIVELLNEAKAASEKKDYAGCVTLATRVTGMTTVEPVVAAALMQAAMCSAASGDRDKAFEYLTKAVESDLHTLNGFTIDKFLTVEVFRALHSDPRWDELVAKLRSRL